MKIFELKNQSTATPFCCLCDGVLYSSRSRWQVALVLLCKGPFKQKEADRQSETTFWLRKKNCMDDLCKQKILRIFFCTFTHICFPELYRITRVKHDITSLTKHKLHTTVIRRVSPFAIESHIYFKTKVWCDFPWKSFENQYVQLFYDQINWEKKSVAKFVCFWKVSPFSCLQLDFLLTLRVTLLYRCNLKTLRVKTTFFSSYVLIFWWKLSNC